MLNSNAARVLVALDKFDHLEELQVSDVVGMAADCDMTQTQEIISFFRKSGLIGN